MKVKVPFTSWSEDKLNKGLKTATTRRFKLGEVNDTFFIYTRQGRKRFVFTKIMRVKLHVVHHYYYKQEGCNTKREFEEVWINRHPYRKLDPEWKVWLHLFEEIPVGF